MLTRRAVLSPLLAAPLAAVPTLCIGRLANARTPAQPARSHAPSATSGFAEFLSGVESDARRQGISSATLRAALTGLQPNSKVLSLDSNQAEFTQTWQHYRDTRLSANRIALGRNAYAADRSLFDAVSTQYGVSSAVIAGIWGLETNYGGFTGGFNVVEALATLAWDGRRASFFRPELLAALAILDHGDVTVARMQGSYAGAMGQPQFMPTSFKRYAVDFDGDGRRNIWDDRADVLASIANYLAKSGWQERQPWGLSVLAPDTLSEADAGKSSRAPLTAWARRGVRLADGARLPDDDVSAYLVLPAGQGGEAFLAYPNFAAIRRYNPSDFYALAVGLLGDRVVG